MNREELLTYITTDIVINGTLYLGDNLPSQISNAIYIFGNHEIYEILAFIDTSEALDGSLGMIITPNHIFFKFAKTGSFKYDNITSLALEKHHNDPLVKAIIKTIDTTYVFKNKKINVEVLLKLLAKITNLEIEMILSYHEKVAFYVPIILADIVNDEYEDVILTPQQIKIIQEFYTDLDKINNLENDNYKFELQLLCKRALDFFEQLELDSEEIDILFEVQQYFDNQDEQKIDNAKKIYDDMMDKYQQGDHAMFDQIKGMMASLGIDENDLIGKSPEEIENFLCSRFGISKSMLKKMTEGFKA